MLAKAEATVLFCLSAGAVGGLKAYPRPIITLFLQKKQCAYLSYVSN